MCEEHLGGVGFLPLGPLLLLVLLLLPVLLVPPLTLVAGLSRLIP